MQQRLVLAAILLVLAACASARPSTTTAADPSQDARVGRARPAAAEPARTADKVGGGMTEAEFKALHAAPSGAVPPLKGKEVTVGGAKAYLSLPASAKAALPGVVVIHEWWGLNDHVRHWTDRLAAEGYAAVAVDLYGGVVATTPDEAMAAIKKVDDAQALAILRAAHEFLVEDERIRAPRTASIGWCFGGRKSLELALAEPELDACVMYYGNPITEASALATMKAELLGVFGSRDKSIPPEKLAAFRAGLEDAGKVSDIREYDAEHAFANPSNPRYDEVNAGQAWEVTRAFLKRKLAR